MRITLFILFSIFISLSCPAQPEERVPGPEEMELQLTVIDGMLKLSYHRNPYDYDKQEALYEAFEHARDSLQGLFYTTLESICRGDSAMRYPFEHLGNVITIAASPDWKMRVFTRDTYTGGTMPYLCSYVQCRRGDSVYFGYLPEISGGNYVLGDSNESGLYYDKIYMFKDESKEYYLLAGKSRLSSAVAVSGLRAVSLGRHGITNEPLFFTDRKTSSSLAVAYSLGSSYDYERSMYIGDDVFPRIVFDADIKTVMQPEVRFFEELSGEYLTGEVIGYKWENSMFRK